MDKTVNRLLGLDEILSQRGREVWETLYNLVEVDQKLDFIQELLVELLRKSQRHSALVEFSVAALKSADGRMPIHELERRTGYTRQYLDLLFRQHVGISKRASRNLPLSEVLPAVGAGAVLQRNEGRGVRVLL